VNRQIQGVGKQITEQIFGPASEEIARVRRKLRKIELYVFTLLNININININNNNNTVHLSFLGT
jgi:hypothetical protein